MMLHHAAVTMMLHRAAVDAGVVWLPLLRLLLCIIDYGAIAAAGADLRPSHIEWLNGRSCNAIFGDEYTAKRA